MELELTTSITNLIMGGLGAAAVIVLFLEHTHRSKHKILWIRLFTTFSVSSFLGYFNHAFTQTIWETVILWAVMYFCMFESARIIALLGLDAHFDSGPAIKKINRWLVVPEILLYIGAMIFRPINTITSMLFYLAYGSAMAVFALVFTFILIFSQPHPHRPEAIVVLISLFMTVPAIVFQYIKKGSQQIFLCFDHNGVSHLIIILCVIIMIIGAIISLRNQAGKTNP